MVEPGGSSLTYIIGELATIPCFTSLEHPVEWSHSATKGSEPHIVYTGGNVYNGYRTRFSVDVSVKQRYNLIIKDIQPSDAGVYQCIDDEGLGDRKLFFVSVIPQGIKKC